MMTNNAMLDSFRKKVCSAIDIEPHGVNRFIIYTPFMFDDGDHYVAVLRKEDDKWVIGDEGHTFMHLDYGDVDVTKGTRAKMIEESLARHGVENVEGEIRVDVPDECFGDALFSYLQAISQAVHVGTFTKDRAASTFREDLEELLVSLVPPERIILDWHDPDHDPEGHYPVDCKINGSGTPWFIFGVNSNDKCQDATIACLTFEKWEKKFHSVAIFEDQTKIPGRTVAQLSDVIGKQFSSLSDRRRIEQFFRNEILF